MITFVSAKLFIYLNRMRYNNDLYNIKSINYIISKAIIIIEIYKVSEVARFKKSETALVSLPSISTPKISNDYKIVYHSILMASSGRFRVATCNT